jgi:acetyl-CoA carboxylase alpha subunit
MGNVLKGYLLRYLRELRGVPAEELLEGRYQKFRRMGVFVEGLTTGEESASPAGDGAT